MSKIIRNYRLLIILLLCFRISSLFGLDNTFITQNSLVLVSDDPVPDDSIIPEVVPDRNQLLFQFGLDMGGSEGLYLAYFFNIGLIYRFLPNFGIHSNLYGISFDYPLKWEVGLNGFIPIRENKFYLNLMLGTFPIDVFSDISSRYLALAGAGILWYPFNFQFLKNLYLSFSIYFDFYRKLPQDDQIYYEPFVSAVLGFKIIQL
jgi:hypothetical protein